MVEKRTYRISELKFEGYLTKQRVSMTGRQTQCNKQTPACSTIHKIFLKDRFAQKEVGFHKKRRWDLH